MCQEEVYKFLKRKSNKGKWMTTRQIAEKLKARSGTTARNLLMLYKYDEVQRKEIRVGNHLTYTWRIKE